MQITSLLPRLLGRVPGCPDITAVMALRDAAIEFFDATDAWNEDLEPIIVAADIGTFEIELPKDARLGSLMSARLPHIELERKSRAQLDALLPAWQRASGSPAYFLQTKDDALRIVPMVQQGSSLVGAEMLVRASFVPTMSANTLPDREVQEHLDALIDGALARLMLDEGRSWANPRMAAVREAKFRDAIVLAKLRANTDGDIASMTARPHPFF